MNGGSEIIEKNQSDNKSTDKQEIAQNKFLANCIYIFHLIIILFVLIGSFSNIPAILILHSTFCITLIVHWLASSNECSLTHLEAKLRGLDKTESFTYQFVAPMYDISKTDWSNLCYFITIIVLCISLYKLYHSEQVLESLNCYRKLNKDPEFQELALSSRWKKSLGCFTNLFII
jgi:hypothetical protein